MMTSQQDIHAIVGMGKTGVSIANFLTRRGIACVAFDEHLKALPESLSIPFHRGKLQGKRLSQYQAVWVSPGVRWSHPALQMARDAGVPVQGDLSLFLSYCQVPLLAITGTNGKTTTTQTIQTLLETLPGGCDMGGNIGTPMLDLIVDKDMHMPARIVLELSSFQLERCDAIHPKWAVLLNVQPDHADMHASEEDYRDAKLKVFAHQGEGDTAVLPVDSIWDELCESLKQRGVQVHRFGHVQQESLQEETLMAGIVTNDEADSLFWHDQGCRQSIPCENIPTRGLHQHINLAVAAQAAADFGVGQKVVHEAITSFRGLPHRLRNLGTVAGHAWFDDSKATNPAAAEAALASFDQVIWICGGLLKGLNVMSMRETVKKHVVYAVIIGKDPAPYIRLMQSVGVSYTVAGVMSRAVHFAAEHEGDDPVLLSPAAASMDQFKNYAERGDVFHDAIRALNKGT